MKYTALFLAVAAAQDDDPSKVIAAAFEKWIAMKGVADMTPELVKDMNIYWTGMKCE